MFGNGVRLTDPIPAAVHLWVPTQVALILSPLPFGMIGFSMDLGHLHPDGSLGPISDRVIAARPAQAAQIMESIQLSAERAGVAPLLRSHRDEARKANARFR